MAAHSQSTGLQVQGSCFCDLPDVGEGVALREVVGMPLPEDVAHPAAGHDLQAPAAHPHPEGELWGRQQPSGGGRAPWQVPLSKEGKGLASFPFCVSLEAHAEVGAPGPVCMGASTPDSLHVL